MEPCGTGKMTLAYLSIAEMSVHVLMLKEPTVVPLIATRS